MFHHFPIKSYKHFLPSFKWLKSNTSPASSPELLGDLSREDLETEAAMCCVSLCGRRLGEDNLLRGADQKPGEVLTGIAWTGRCHPDCDLVSSSLRCCFCWVDSAICLIVLFNSTIWPIFFYRFLKFSNFFVFSCKLLTDTACTGSVVSCYWSVGSIGLVGQAFNFPLGFTVTNIMTSHVC